ncbi:MAG: VWA domain-containing protein [Bacillota bacterium]
MNGHVPDWASVEPAGGERHLPVYLLIDRSGSMEGEPLRQVMDGLALFKQEVSSDPFARDTVRIGVITFSDKAELVTGGLLSVQDFQPPHIQAGGVTRLDLAFAVLRESIGRHVVRPVKGSRKGDWKPIVFLLTDGRPTDERGRPADALWRSAREALMQPAGGLPRPAALVPVGCGPEIENATLKEISTGVAFRLGVSDASFASLFLFITQSITSSVAPGGNPSDPFAGISTPQDVIRIP